MIDEIKNQYLSKITQVILLDKSGHILESDDILFKASKTTCIAELHPFFEIIIQSIKENYDNIIFNCIHLEIDQTKGSYDIILNNSQNNANPFIIIVDFTEHYESFQSIAQEKNESVLSFHYEKIKNDQLLAEKKFKDKFIANISHDLRTPVAAILGFLELFEKVNISTSQRDIIQTINKTSLHLKGLVDDLLDISKIESGEFILKNKPLDLKDMFNQLEKIYLLKAAAKNIDLTFDIEEKIPKNIIADRVKLFQIFTNLLDNAIKFTDEGSVKLMVKENFRSSDNLSLNVQVLDTGIGIPIRNRNKIFESFTKLHSKNIDGLGIGLSIVYKIVQLMNGSIKIQSIRKKGTIIEANIQLKIDVQVYSRVKPKEIKEYTNADFKRKYNILIADNSEINQLLIMKILVNHGGFYFDIAENGLQAVDLFEKNDYDCILMDVDMPFLDGIEASKMIKNHEDIKKSKTPIIALSANPNDTEKLICKAIGIKNYLTRPHTKDELFESLYKALKIKALK
ncbi:hypothetical protein B0A58_05160 [Flavobacterium branchiophilum NBRC 15030 = ATCC 35035]|uniref:histidine kinase n=1 Tax=Flavobacterium branchiophilum TaxID=55197 RepID=A0A543G208_9FLAO|nr:ATP-binding protein [Flavobacterium branchiophilum]OXA77776.1 hypothetical protein B0A58_05160 [Flavobacterium branchiophilum NBRC 15030 = ATCC 35035]TQM40064.1 phospho-acceptor domain-containing protein [Flavobacterium branchiophilum]GEM56192.1 hypothetical protein FB1_24130 [Flavobacterium branchiophilum NBRC 15030 = ATCC 35035]